MRNRTLVVGVDGSDGGRRALRWALGDVTDRGGFVHAVTAWQGDARSLGPGAVDTIRAQAAMTLKREVRAVSAEFRYPPPVTSRVGEGDAATVLSRAARDADLLVLGSHGHGRRSRDEALGSVAAACVRQATCPVVVVPVPYEQAPKPRGALAETA